MGTTREITTGSRTGEPEEDLGMARRTQSGPHRELVRAAVKDLFEVLVPGEEEDVETKGA